MPSAKEKPKILRCNRCGDSIKEDDYYVSCTGNCKCTYHGRCTFPRIPDAALKRVADKWVCEICPKKKNANNTTWCSHCGNTCPLPVKKEKVPGLTIECKSCKGVFHRQCLGHLLSNTCKACDKTANGEKMKAWFPKIIRNEDGLRYQLRFVGLLGTKEWRETTEVVQVIDDHRVRTRDNKIYTLMLPLLPEMVTNACLPPEVPELFKKGVPKRFWDAKKNPKLLEVPKVEDPVVTETFASTKNWKWRPVSWIHDPKPSSGRFAGVGKVQDTTPLEKCSNLSYSTAPIAAGRELQILFAEVGWVDAVVEYSNAAASSSSSSAPSSSSSSMPVVRFPAIASNSTFPYDHEAMHKLSMERRIRVTAKNPKLQNQPNKWTEEEDKVLLEAYQAFAGGSTDMWSKIAAKVADRSVQDCMERYQTLSFKPVTRQKKKEGVPKASPAPKIDTVRLMTMRDGPRKQQALREVIAADNARQAKANQDDLFDELLKKPVVKDPGPPPKPNPTPARTKGKSMTREEFDKLTAQCTDEDDIRPVWVSQTDDSGDGPVEDVANGDAPKEEQQAGAQERDANQTPLKDTEDGAPPTKRRRQSQSAASQESQTPLFERAGILEQLNELGNRKVVCNVATHDDEMTSSEENLDSTFADLRKPVNVHARDGFIFRQQQNMKYGRAKREKLAQKLAREEQEERIKQGKSGGVGNALDSTDQRKLRKLMVAEEKKKKKLAAKEGQDSDEEVENYFSEESEKEEDSEMDMQIPF